MMHGPGAVSASQPYGNGGARARRAGDEHPPRRRLPVPIGSYAELKDGELWLRALVGAPDGSQLVRGERRGPAEQAEALGISLAEELLDNGAREILAAVYDGEARDEHTGHSSTTARRSAGQPSAGHGTRGTELSADKFTPGRSFPRWAMRFTGARRSAICAIPACGGIRPCPSAAAGPAPPTSPRYFAIGRTTALALHTVSGQHIHYPLDRKLAKSCYNYLNYKTLPGKCADPTRQWRAGTLRRDADRARRRGQHL